MHLTPQLVFSYYSPPSLPSLPLSLRFINQVRTLKFCVPPASQDKHLYPPSGRSWHLPLVDIFISKKFIIHPKFNYFQITSPFMQLKPSLFRKVCYELWKASVHNRPFSLRSHPPFITHICPNSYRFALTLSDLHTL